jgi:hypothetical protein
MDGGKQVLQWCLSLPNDPGAVLYQVCYGTAIRPTVSMKSFKRKTGGNMGSQIKVVWGQAVEDLEFLP